MRKQGRKSNNKASSPSLKGYAEEKLKDINALVKKSPNLVGVLRNKTM